MHPSVPLTGQQEIKIGLALPGYCRDTCWAGGGEVTLLPEVKKRILWVGDSVKGWWSKVQG